MNKTAIIGIVGVVIVGIVLYMIFAVGEDDMLVDNTNSDANIEQSADGNTNNTGNTSNSQNSGTNNNGGDIPNTPNTVVITETETGNFVTVASTRLAQDGYIVAYQVDSNGESEVVGHSDLLQAGTHTNVQLQLDTVLAEQQAVVVVLHEDDGDGVFEYPDSDQYLLNPGMIIVSDIDVVDVSSEDAESRALEAQVEAVLENWDSSEGE